MNEIFGGTERDQFVKDVIFSSNYVLSAEEAYQRFLKKAESPWTFFRANNPLFWNDLAECSLVKKFGNHENSTFWICGDAHYQNIGAYNKHENVVYFVNDFDDSVVADYVYDLLRMAVAFHLTGKNKAEDISRIFLESYLHAILHQTEDLDVEYRSENLSEKLAVWLEEIKHKKWFKRKKWLKKMTRQADDEVRFRVKRKLQYINFQTENKVREAMRKYKPLSDGEFPQHYFDILSVAKRLEGLGSFLRDRYYVLLRGNCTDEIKLKNTILLDVKFQTKPSAFINSKRIEKDTMTLVENHGQRVVDAQTAMERNPDIHLGFVKIKNSFFSIRQALPIDEKYLVKFKKPKKYHTVFHDWGRVFATAHVRSAHKLNKDFCAFIAERFCQDSEIKHFVEEMNKTAAVYAKQIHYDFKAWKTISLNIDEEIQKRKHKFKQET